jgi:hypothetical protein
MTVEARAAGALNLIPVKSAVKRARILKIFQKKQT